jgi:hypothetical protein
MAKYTKKYLLFSLLILLTASTSYSQLTVGAGSLHIKAGGHIYVAGLDFNPSADMQIQSNSIVINTTPVNFVNGNSINRVYEFTVPITFSGTIKLRYSDDELNGNTANQLGIIYRSADDEAFTAAPAGINENQILESTFATVSTFKVISAANNTVTLPLTLIDFSVKDQNNSNNITWITSNEINVDYFEVLKSNDGVNFSLFKNVPARQPSENKTIYTFLDRSPFNGANYYQIIQYDKNGTRHDLGVRHINNSFVKDIAFKVYPNPGRAPIYLNAINYPGKKLNVSLLNTNGKLVYSEMFNASVDTTSYLLKTDSALPAGIYILNIVCDDFSKHSLKIILE